MARARPEAATGASSSPARPTAARGLERWRRDRARPTPSPEPLLLKSSAATRRSPFEREGGAVPADVRRAASRRRFRPGAIVTVWPLPALTRATPRPRARETSPTRTGIGDGAAGGRGFRVSGRRRLLAGGAGRREERRSSGPFEAADRRDREVGDDQRRRRLDLSSFGLEQPERDRDREQSRRARYDPARLEEVLREAHGAGSQTATAVPPNRSRSIAPRAIGAAGKGAPSEAAGGAMPGGTAAVGSPAAGADESGDSDQSVK